MKKAFSAALRIAVSFGLLSLLFWIMRDDMPSIFSAVKEGNFYYLGAAMFSLSVMVWMLAVRLKVVFQGEDLFLTIKRSVELTCVGFFFNNFMPTAVGGDILKAHYASHFNRQKMRSYASVLMDRVIGMLAILMVAGVAVAVDRGRLGLVMVRPFVIMLLLAGAAGTAAVTNRKVAHWAQNLLKRLKLKGLGDKFAQMYSIIHDYRNRPGVVVRSILYSFGAQVSNCVVLYFLFLMMGRPVSFGSIFLILPVIIFVSMLPSLGGIGVRESATVALFSVVAGREASFAVSLLVLGGNLAISFAGALVYMWWSFRPVPAEKFTEEQILRRPSTSSG